MLDKMKQLMEMQKKMQEMKRALEATVFDVESADRLVKLTMNGAQEVKGVSIQKEPSQLDKALLERAIQDAYNRGLKRSQQIAADKMKEITGFNIPGLM